MNRGLFYDMPAVTVGFENIPNAINRLSFEHSSIDYIASVFKNIVPSALGKVKEIAANLSTVSDESETTKELNKLFPSVEKKLQNLSFTTYSKLVVTIPEGYAGYLVDNLKTMDVMMAEVYAAGYKMLTDYKTLIGLYISNKNYREAMRDHTAFYKATARTREQLTQKLGTVFPSTQPQSRAYLARVIQNFQQVKLVVEMTNRLDKENNRQNLPAFMKEVQRCVELLDILHDSFEKDSNAEMTKEAAANISEGAYEVAKFVEFVSLFRFRTEQITACSLNMVKTLENLN